MTPLIGQPRHSTGAILAALALILTLPASSLGGHGGFHTAAPAYLTLLGAYAPGGSTPGELVPLIASGEGEADLGMIFNGIPDGVGITPGDAAGTIDIYVAHEESHVPFPIGGPVDPAPPTAAPRADLHDSSVTRVTVDVATETIVSMEAVIPSSAGLIRFCSAFMAGPEHGFSNYTFFVNEESNDILPVPVNAPYGPDPALSPNRQAGYSVWLDTETEEFDVITRAGRHNHENTVVVPGEWKELAILSGDDTFTAPASQLYLYTTKDAASLMADKGQLWAFQVTGTDEGTVDPYDRFNDANDFLDIAPGDDWSGRFIHVPTEVARGLTSDPPQTALENWSNANNVFQFVRVEDLAYDPANPRVIYFTDTGTTRLWESDETGRLIRKATSGDRPYYDTDGRMFRMVLNEKDPRIVDSFSILAQGRLQRQDPGPVITVIDAGVGFVNPDNLAIGERSMMVQEDSASNNDIWMHPLGTSTWTKVATVAEPPGVWPAPANPGESSGIVDASEWIDQDGWWALTIQSHREQYVDTENILYWPDGPDTGSDPDPYRERREHGQLLLMYIPGS